MFIDDHREHIGVEAICKVLPIAPSTYYHHKSIELDPEKASVRAKRDTFLYQAARMLTHGGFPTHQKSDSMVVCLGGRDHGYSDCITGGL